MSKPLFAILVPAMLMAAPLSALAIDECELPPAPASVPDGATATGEEMQEAATQIRAYNAVLTEHGDCLDAMRDAVLDMRGGDEKKAMTEKYEAQSAAYNDALDAFEDMAAEFNAQVGIYRANNE